MTKPRCSINLMIAVFFVFITQSCVKMKEPTQVELIVSAKQIVLFAPTNEFSIFITNKPEIADKWTITSLPYFIVAEEKSGTINKSVAELKFKLNPEVNHLQYYPPEHIEISTKYSGIVSIEVSYLASRLIDLDFQPELLHFNEGDTIKNLKIRNNTLNKLIITMHPQYPWIRFSNNYPGNEYYRKELLELYETDIPVELDLEYEGYEVGRQNNMILIEFDHRNTRYLYAYQITADIPEIKRIIADKSSLTFNYNDSTINLCLHNTGNVPVNWIASCEADYIQILPKEGSLARNEQICVEIKLDRENFSQFEYQTHIRFDWGDGLIVIPVNALHDPALWDQFPSILSVDYSKAVDKLIMITSSKALVLYDPVTHQQQEIPSLQGANSFKLNEDGTFAVVAKYQHIARLNLLTLAVDKEQPLYIRDDWYNFYGSDELYYLYLESFSTAYHRYINLSTSETSAYLTDNNAKNMELNPNQPILYANSSDKLYTYNIASNTSQVLDTASIYYSTNLESWTDYKNNIIYSKGQVFNISNPPNYLPELIGQIGNNNEHNKHLHSSEELEMIFLLNNKIYAYDPEQNYAFSNEYEIPLYVEYEFGNYTLIELNSFFCFTRPNDPQLHLIAGRYGRNFYTTLAIEK